VLHGKILLHLFSDEQKQKAKKVQCKCTPANINDYVRYNYNSFLIL